MTVDPGRAATPDGEFEFGDRVKVLHADGTTVCEGQIDGDGIDAGHQQWWDVRGDDGLRYDHLDEDEMELVAKADPAPDGVVDGAVEGIGPALQAGVRGDDPYLVTATTPDDRTGPSGEAAPDRVTQIAGVTLDEVRGKVQAMIFAAGDSLADTFDAGAGIGSGWSYTASDGTSISVALVTAEGLVEWADLDAVAAILGDRPMSSATPGEACAAFNATYGHRPRTPSPGGASTPPSSSTSESMRGV